jgi:Bacterial type II/III secretion system short domain
MSRQIVSRTFCGLCAALLAASWAVAYSQESEREGGTPAPGARRNGARPNLFGAPPGTEGLPPGGLGPGRVRREPEPERAAVDTSRNKRSMLRARNAPATSLAASLNRFFAGMPEIQVVGDPQSNSILISAPSEIIDEVLESASKLDRAPLSVTVEVTIVELPLTVAGDRAGPAGRKKFDPREFSGPAEKIRDKLDELARTGQVQRLKRLRVLGIDNQLVQSQDNEDKPWAAVVAAPASGPALGGRPSALPRIGSMMQCTSRVSPGEGVMMELVIHDLPRPEAAEANQLPADAPSSNFLGTIFIPFGKALVVNSLERASTPHPSLTLFIVAPQVGNPEADKPDTPGL